jgi:hypothetical protein
MWVLDILTYVLLSVIVFVPMWLLIALSFEYNFSRNSVGIKDTETYLNGLPKLLYILYFVPAGLYMNTLQEGKPSNRIGVLVLRYIMLIFIVFFVALTVFREIESHENVEQIILALLWLALMLYGLYKAWSTGYRLPDLGK